MQCRPKCSTYLVPIVDADVGVRWPYQYRIYAPIPLTQIVHKFVNSVGAFNWVPEETVVRMRLRLDVTALGPSARHG